MHCRIAFFFAAVSALVSHVQATEPDRKADGWHGWPREAPPPARAPFDADAAHQHQTAWATFLNVPVEYTNSIGMRFRLIPPGEFSMGASPEEQAAAEQILEQWFRPNDPLRKTVKGSMKHEGPVHRVVLTRPFYLAVREVTQKEYHTVMGVNPADFSSTGENQRALDLAKTYDLSGFPVEHLTWFDAVAFCNKLSEREHRAPNYARDGAAVSRLPGHGYRLPTEAEWEHACRAGTTTWYWTGNDKAGVTRADVLPSDELAKLLFAGRDKAFPANPYRSNPFGLLFLHGNVQEFCWDWWREDTYASAGNEPRVDPQGPDRGTQRVVRGGTCELGLPYDGRSARRLAQSPDVAYSWTGFRLAAELACVQQHADN